MTSAKTHCSLAALALLAGVLGCAPSAPSLRPPVVLRDAAPAARVCVAHQALQPGEQVQFTRVVCSYQPPKDLVRSCQESVVATLKVLRVDDDGCLLVAGASSGALASGDRLAVAAHR